MYKKMEIVDYTHLLIAFSDLRRLVHILLIRKLIRYQVSQLKREKLCPVNVLVKLVIESY